MKALKRLYGSPRLNNKDDPLDELFFIILSQMTTGPSYERVFERLKAEIPSWSGLLRIATTELGQIIQDAGLSGQKAPRLKAIADRLQSDFGDVSLDALRTMSNEDALVYLRTLPGVGVKTAKCVLMYSLGREVLPVDTHTARLAFRLGLVSTPNHATADREISHSVGEHLRYDFHVNAVAHGRAVCLALRPRCSDCVLIRLCPTGRNSRTTLRKRNIRHGRVERDAPGADRCPTQGHAMNERIQ